VRFSQKTVEKRNSLLIFLPTEGRPSWVASFSARWYYCYHKISPPKASWP